MSRIVQLTAENVKRLHAVQITPTGNLIIIGGKNGQGKTSVLDSIAMALGGANEIPSMPVRRGEKKASVVLDLGDIVVKRTFTAQENGGATSALVVENKDKMRASSPQSVLEKLTGKVTFDPLAFIMMEPAKQAATLKRLVGLDFSALDSQRAKIYQERTLVNRDHDRENSRLALMPQHQDAPQEEQDVTAIISERDAALTHNAQHDTLAAKLDAAASSLSNAERVLSSYDADIKDLEEKLAALKQRRDSHAETLPQLKSQADAAKSSLDAFQVRDLAAINQRLAEAEVVNGKVRQNRERSDALVRVNAIKEKSQAFTSQINEIDRQKDEALAAIKFPVAGLSFTADGQVAFNGVPFDQASAAERLRVSVAIAAAMNPTLRVMLVRDASLLDDDGLAQLGKLAEEFDLQVWAERVGKGAECSVIIEDGAISQPEEDSSGKEDDAA